MFVRQKIHQVLQCQRKKNFITPLQFSERYLSEFEIVALLLAFPRPCFSTSKTIYTSTWVAQVSMFTCLARLQKAQLVQVIFNVKVLKTIADFLSALKSTQTSQGCLRQKFIFIRRSPPPTRTYAFSRLCPRVIEKIQFNMQLQFPYQYTNGSSYMRLTCLYSASLVKLFGKEFTDNKCPFGRNFRWLPNDSRFSTFSRILPTSHTLPTENKDVMVMLI